MKHYLIAVLISTMLLSCSKDAGSVKTEVKAGTAANNLPAPMFRYSGSDYSQAISVDFANQMINSYLTSIDYEHNPYGLRSFVFDADTLRSYLNDTTHGRIATLKFMMAHQESYLDNGNYGVNAGFDGRAITFVIVGLNEDDEYIYNRNDAVYDNIRPCPIHCDNSGVNLTPVN